MKEAENHSAGSTPLIDRRIDPIAIVRRRWRLLTFGVVIGLLAAALYQTTATRIYRSSIEVLVGQRSSEATSNGTLSGSQTGDGLGEDQLATHMRLFIARKVLSTAIQTGHLDEFPGFKQTLADGGSAVDYIIENIKIDRGGEGSAADAMVLRAEFESADPDESAAVLAAIYASYKQYTDTQGDDSTDLAVELIDAARKTHETELSRAEQSYRDYVSSMPVLLEGDQTKEIHKERLANLEIELTQVRSRLSESRSRLQVIESANELAAAAAEFGIAADHDLSQLALLSQKEVERLKFFLDISRGGAQSESFQAEMPMRAEAARANYSRLLDLVQREKTLSDNFGSGHPLVEAAHQERLITQEFIASHKPQNVVEPKNDLKPTEMLATYVKLLRHDIAEMEKRETILLADSRKEMALAKGVESEFMKVESLRKQMDRAQDRYDQVIRRLQELNLSRSYAGFSTDLLAHPEVAQRAAWPILPLVAALGMCTGILLGSTLAIAAEMFDSTFNGIEDLESTVRSTVITHVPRMDLRQLRRGATANSPIDPSLVTFHNPRGSEAEIYRVGRTSLMIAAKKERLRTIMVTSPQPGDGKSTTISNLAISVAQAGKRVLLIDADMRRPVISSLFGLGRQLGLSDVLLQRVPLAGAISKTAVKNLHILPHGSTTDEPAELLESHNLARVLQAAAGAYDMVLVDAPPVLAVADPAIVAPSVDGVLLTVRVTKNGRSIVEDAMRILNDIDITPIGVVVNGVEKAAMKSYQDGSYKRNKYGYIGKYHKHYQSQAGGTVPIEVPHIPAPAIENTPPPRTVPQGTKSHGIPAPTRLNPNHQSASAMTAGLK